MGDDADRILAVGLSHHTAPVEVRERIAMDEAMVRRELARLRSEHVCEEALLLSTCNRVELYAVPSDAERLRDYFDGFRTTDGTSVSQYLYWKRGGEAVQHLFTVAASLDSLVVGEPQILGQVKEAVRVASEENALGRILQPLSARTLSVAKRVRTQTDIGRSRVGIGNAGVDLALQIFGGLEGRRALLLGVGEMGRQVARALLTAGLDELIVANRTYEHAATLASEQGFTAIRWERLAEYLPLADVVITATSAPKPIVSVDMIRRAIRARRYRPMFLVDLSVPRNVEAAVADLEEAYLFNVDDLQRVVKRGRQERAEAAQEAQAMVAAEVARFIASLNAIDVAPTLRQMMSQAEAIRQAEISRSRRLVGGLDADQTKQLDALTRALVKKLLHGHVGALREAAKRGDAQAVEVLTELWKE
ncbi:MAG: glutamyl-tRNA reductase [Myxococcota bacterium]|jgi:glutamyl-tRNA reductase